ncbi:MAG: chlorophyll a/b-binding protein [Vulcanococcus sp.]
MSSADSITPDPAAADSAPTPPATSATTNDVPAFGWSAYAERVNGRFAMLGFAAVLLVEVISGQTFLKWAGFVG